MTSAEDQSRTGNQSGTHSQPSTAEELLAAGRIAPAAQALRDGEVTSTDLARASLAAAERMNGELRALAHVFAEDALAQAAASDARFREGTARGLLDGIPVAVKENFAMEGKPWECGSAVLAQNRADHNATAVDALLSQGAVVIGSATMDEFALTTIGPARTPLAPERTAGGSSGGSGSAVASGMVFAALGSDTGGSVRIPAAACGIAGLKPSMDLIPTAGVTTLAWSLDHVGPLARTSEDLRIVVSALTAGSLQEGGDRSSAAPGDADLPGSDATLQGVRLGVPSAEFLAVCTETVREDFQRSLAAAEAAGAVLVPVELPLPGEIGAVHWPILAAEMYAYHAARFGTEEARYRPALRDSLRDAAQISREDYLNARRRRDALRRRVDAVLEDVDVIALPTLVTLPPLAGETVISTPEPEDATTVLVRLTSLANHTGHPALSVRPGLFPDDHIFGLQLVGAFMDDKGVLGCGSAFEALGR
ncbi:MULTISPECIES: amidase [Brevibacterium]|uniref:Amidase n=1 Tax=Brevibacterium salitolerans TaxID=1403566 RepID=A0ABP5I4C9_9MICO|nr:amidase [Brevibacterium sp.]